MATDKPGCLAVLVGLFRAGARVEEVSEAKVLPYRLRDDFLSRAERSFLGVLHSVTRDTYVICPKVNLADIFFVARPNENQVYRNKIDRKHIDFLLCDPATMRPRIGIELDDSSHQRIERQVRDEFVGQVFEAGGLPLLRFPVRTGYNPAEIKERLGELDRADAPSPRPVSPTEGDVPICPKCGITLVLRTAGRGANTREPFYGCSNFPRCRETVALPR